MGVHPIAILKGAVEGDATAHLASLLGWDQHVAAAAGAGLVEQGAGPYDVTPTLAGREFYARYRLAALPGGRANAWTGDLIDAAVAALREG